MSAWSLLLCEGAHDQAGVRGLLRTCAGWQTAQKTDLPSTLQNVAIPRLKKEGRDADLLARGADRLAIRSLPLKDLLGENALDLLRPVRDALDSPPIRAVGVIVDANGDGVAARLAAYREWYSRLWDHAKAVTPGAVAQGSPRLGLWVMPDNAANGTFDDVIVRAAETTRPDLLAAARRFIDETQPFRAADGKRPVDRTKALLGIMSQADAPAAALASALRDGPWFDARLSTLPPFQGLLAFLDALTRP